MNTKIIDQAYINFKYEPTEENFERLSLLLKKTIKPGQDEKQQNGMTYINQLK